MNFVAGFILMVAGRVPDAAKALLIVRAIRVTGVHPKTFVQAAPGCIFADGADDGQVLDNLPILHGIALVLHLLTGKHVKN